MQWQLASHVNKTFLQNDITLDRVGPIRITNHIVEGGEKKEHYVLIFSQGYYEARWIQHFYSLEAIV